jgi:hypothetical protein
MDINAAVRAIEELLRTYEGVIDAQVRPSGDDTDVIKVWVDLGGTGDPKAWAATCEQAIRAALPDAAAFRLQVRAERD